MNKNDFKLIIVIILIVGILFLFRFINKKQATTALVYHGSEVILKIDLNINGEYIVDGDNGDVTIKVLDKKIKVLQENSPYHLCSKQGYISNSGESIICLPNRIIIELPKNDDVDTEVK